MTDRKEPYWIQVECPSTNRGQTSAMFIDLNLIQHVKMNRVGTSDNVNYVQFSYPTVPAGISYELKDEKATWFIEEWLKFVKLQAVMEKGRPSLIDIADTAKTGNLIQGRQ